MQPVHGVLFICSANSARSSMAEAILRRAGRGRFRAFSAGSHPAPRAHPDAVALLRRHGHRTEELRPKGWDVFPAQDAPQLDLIITVCDQAAQLCPLWPGPALTAHWPMPAPAPGGPEGFVAACRALNSRINALARLPWDALAPAQRKRSAQEIGACKLGEGMRDVG